MTIARLHHLCALRYLKLEEFGVERRVHLFLVEVEFEDGVVEAGHLDDLADLAVGATTNSTAE